MTNVPTDSHQGLSVSFLPEINVIHINTRLILYPIHFNNEGRCHPCTPKTLIQFGETHTCLDAPYRRHSGLHSLIEVQTNIYKV